MAFDFLGQRSDRNYCGAAGGMVCAGIEGAPCTGFRPGGTGDGANRAGDVDMGVIEGPHAGWGSALILGLFVTAAMAFLAFALYEPRRRPPLLDLRSFNSVPFSGQRRSGAQCAFSSFSRSLSQCAVPAAGARIFCLIHTGLFTLPLAVTMIVKCALVRWLVATERAHWASGAGLLLSSLMLTGLSPQTSVGWLGYSICTVRLGMVNPAISNSAVDGMPLSQRAWRRPSLQPAGRSITGCLDRWWP